MIKCYFCKGEIKPGRVRAIRERNGDIFVLDGVPADVCQQCGEQFFTGPVAKEMDRLMNSGDAVAERLEVPLIVFGEKQVA